jgi:hypothetical protein
MRSTTLLTFCAKYGALAGTGDAGLELQLLEDHWPELRHCRPAPMLQKTETWAKERVNL